MGDMNVQLHSRFFEIRLFRVNLQSTVMKGVQYPCLNSTVPESFPTTPCIKSFQKACSRQYFHAIKCASIS